MQRNEDLIRVLNEAISLEYGALFLLPQHIAQVKDEELKRQLRLIQDMELEHAEKTAQMIYQLGSEPKADLPQLRPRSSIREILEAHVEGENKAIDVYTRAEASATEPGMKNMLSDLRREEEGHLRLLQRALERV
ncbi:MAG: ferritin-like domain-containing protein [Armatimonadota bacterium]